MIAQYAAETPTVDPDDATDSQDRLVLVIDDDAALRRAVADVLELEDIPAITASNGGEGVALYRERAGEVGLVLLDRSMPGLNGEETLAELQRIDPDVRVILVSGHDRDELAWRFEGKGLSGFIEKPYDPARLVLEVRRHRMA